jgi:hypothetical protein
MRAPLAFTASISAPRIAGVGDICPDLGEDLGETE